MEELRNVIKEWNATRLDLFEISEPNQNLEFHGVMRFFFQDAGQKVATKCIRVSSTASTNDVIEILIEKFRPDIRMLTFAEYALYVIHESGEERKLDSTEKPLVVQLNWNKDDREGRFLLRRMDEKTMLPEFESKSKAVNKANEESNSFKRKLSKREKKEKKKKEKDAKLLRKEDGDDKTENKEKLAEKLYNELPETSFTRSISNPEAVMRRRRQQKLEKKLQQLVNEGGSEAGGTLRIFGENLNKDVPYKTLLLSTKENSQFVVKEILEKYGLDKENPNDYCLVQLIVPPNLANLDKELDITTIQNLSENIKEYILDDDDCPLVIERLHNKNLGILTFHIRKKPENYQPRKRKKNLLNPQRMDNTHDESYPYLIEINSDNNRPPRKHTLYMNVTEVGCANAPSGTGHNKHSVQNRQYLHLVGGNVQPKHCVIANIEGIVTVTPQINGDSECETFVNNLKINDTTILKHGMLVRFGKVHTFNFIDPNFEAKNKQLSPDLINQMQNSKLNLTNNGLTHDHSNHHANETHHLDDSAETVSNYSKTSKKSEEQTCMTLENQLKKSEAILPAILELWEETEDLFLNAILNALDVNQVQFKLAPTYTLYMGVRYRASTHFKPSFTLEERAIRLTIFTNKFSELINNLIRINYRDPSALAFWLANSSELLHFLKQDKHLNAFTIDGQEILAESVQIAFKQLVNCLELDLENSMVNFLSENDGEANIAISKMLTVLSGAMALLRKCRVNAALTIQLFSQLFHYINMHLFNQIVGVNQNENTTCNINYCTESWGNLLKLRLNQIEQWAEKQGLELAADCYLSRVSQTATLLQSIKSQQPENLGQIIAIQCFKLNSIQLRNILQRFERTAQANVQPIIPQHLIEQFVSSAEQTADELARNYGREIKLAEEPDLQLPFLLPEDGYSCDMVKGVPAELQEFILPLVLKKLCNLTIQPTSAGFWTIYLNNSATNNISSNISENTHHSIELSKLQNKPKNLSFLNQTQNTENSTEPNTPTVTNSQNSQHFTMPNLHSRSNLQNQTLNQQNLANSSNTIMHQPIYSGPVQSQIPSLNHNQPELTTIKLKKGNSGMGLSIVAARGSMQEQLGIYIKSVVKGGAADMDGRLKAGDQLLKVDGNSLIGITQERAAELMTQTGAIVTLEVAKSAASYNGLATILQQNSPRVPLNKNINNRGPPPAPIIPKSQTTEHLKQQSVSMANLHPYSTYPYPQQHLQQQYQQQLLLQQQQQALASSRPSSQMGMQQMSAAQLAQQRLSTANSFTDERTYQNISSYQQQQLHHRIHASHTGLYGTDQQQILSQQLPNQPNSRPISTILTGRDPDQMHLNYSMSHNNLSGTMRPQHFSSISHLNPQMQTSATLHPNAFSQLQQYVGQQRANLNKQQQAYIMRTPGQMPISPQHQTGQWPRGSYQNPHQMMQYPNTSTLPTRHIPQPGPKPLRHQITSTNQINNIGTMPQLSQPLNHSMPQLNHQMPQIVTHDYNSIHSPPPTQVSYRYGQSGYPTNPNNVNLNSSENSNSSALKNANVIQAQTDQNAGMYQWNDRKEIEAQTQQNQKKVREEEIRELESIGNRNQKQEERLKILRLDQNFQNMATLPLEEEDENLALIEKSDQRKMELKRQEELEKSIMQRLEWQQQQQQLEKQEERLRRLKFEETKLEEELQVTQQVEERLIREARKRKDEPTKAVHYSQQTESENSDEGISYEQQKKLEMFINRNQGSIANSNDTNVQDNAIQSNIQIAPHIQNKSALRQTNDNTSNSENPQVPTTTTTKKVSWNEQIVNNAIIIDDDEEEEEESEELDEEYLEQYEHQKKIYPDEQDEEKIENSFTLQDIDEVLGADPIDAEFAGNASNVNNTPNVIGAQEVYRDPRERIKAEKLKQNVNNSWTSEVPEKLSFKEKMKMFAMEAGQLEENKDKVKVSKAQREIDSK